jgi:hypothetical protein
MNGPPPPVSLGNDRLDTTEEWVITTSGGLITKIEAIDTATQRRTDVSAHAGVPPSNDAAQTEEEESVVTTSGGLITKIQKIDRATQQRTELSREEYAGLVVATALTAYHTGVRDYAAALATGDTNAAQTYYQAMTDYFAGIGRA